MSNESPERSAQRSYIEGMFRRRFPSARISVHYDDANEEIGVSVDSVEFVMHIGSDDSDYTFNCRVSFPLEPDPAVY